LNCAASTSPVDTGNATFTGACDTCCATTSFTDTRINGSCPGNFTIERLWIVTDGCGATANATQRLFVSDTLPPILTLPANITIECNGSRDASVTGNATAVDDCDPAPIVTFTDVTANDGNCSVGGTVQRTWTATGMSFNSGLLGSDRYSRLVWQHGFWHSVHLCEQYPAAAESRVCASA
jgi:hypothetical protein